MDVNTVSQSTDDERIGHELVEVAYKGADDVFAVARAVARTYDVDDVALVEVSVAFVEKHQGCVRSLLEALRIVGIVEA